MTALSWTDAKMKELYVLQRRGGEKKKKKDCNETVSWNTSFNPDLQFKESDLRCLRCEGLTPEVTHLHGKLLSIN